MRRTPEHTGRRFDGECHAVAYPGRPALAVGDGLVLLVAVVAPGTGADRQFIARLLAGRADLAIDRLARVRRRTMINEDRVAVLGERERLGNMVSVGRQSGDENRSRITRRQRSRFPCESDDLVVGREVDGIGADRDTSSGTVTRTEIEGRVGVTGVISIPQHGQSAHRALSAGEDVAVRRHGDVPNVRQVRIHRRAESLRQRQSTVVGITGRSRWIPERQQDCGGDEAEDSSIERDVGLGTWNLGRKDSAGAGVCRYPGYPIP